VALVVRQGMVMTGWGLAVGLTGTLIASRLLVTFLFGVGPSNLATITTVAGILAGVALMASYIPARRAAGVDPPVALRSEWKPPVHQYLRMLPADGWERGAASKPPRALATAVFIL
jgi:hypothetical protein